MTELQICSKKHERFVKGNKTAATVVCNKELRELKLQFDNNGM